MKKNILLLVAALLFTALPSRLFAQTSHIPSNNEEVVMYQVNMRAFSANGNLSGVINKLDHIKELGTNVIYLMPLFKTDQSPYASTDYSKIDPEYGTKEDLKQLITLAHQKDMAVLLDIATNHTGTNHVWLNDPVKKHWWYQQKHITGAQGVLAPPPAHTDWTDVYQLDFDNADLRDSLIKTLIYWVKETNCDGFRFDYTDGQDVMLNDGNSDTKNFKFQFWKQVITELRKQPKELLLFAEGDGNEYFSLDFDLIYGNALFYEFKNWVFNQGQPNSSVAASLNYANGFDYGATNGQLPVRFTSNHDTHAHYGTPSQLFGGDKGQMSAFVVAAYMRGVPMIFSGQEVNTPNQVPFYTKGVNGTINWNGTNGAIHKEYKSIINLRKNSEAIKYGNLTDFSNNDVCAFTKQYNGEEVLVLANLKNSTKSFAIPIAQQGAWKEAYTNTSATLQGSTSLDAYSYKVFRRGHVITATDELLLSNEISIYPNPAATKLHIEGAAEGETVSIFNNMGQLLFHTNTDDIDISTLERGAYLLKIELEGATQIKQFIKE